MKLVSEGVPNLIPLTSSEVRIAIAGMGKMGSYHFEALKQLGAGKHEDYYKGGINTQLKKIRICAICDPQADRIVSIPSIPRFATVEDAIKQTRPHILIVATPTLSHKEIALASLDHGIHTFVEKPIVTTSTDLEELIAAANLNGCRLMAGHIERYNPVSIKIKSLLQNVEPYAENYSFIRTQGHHSRITDDIITDKVIHDLDLALSFFGKIKSIEIVDHKLVDGKIYEARLRILHENGIGGTLFISWLTETGRKKRQVEISQGGHIWKGDFVSKQLWVDGLEIKCQVDGMVKPVNNQIKDELVDFIAYATETAEKQIAPLLTINEIRESTKWLEYLSRKICGFASGTT